MIKFEYVMSDVSQIVEELRRMRQEIEDLKKSRDAPAAPAAAMQEEEWEDDPDEEGAETDRGPGWGSVLPPVMIPPSRPDAIALCNLLRTPPPLDQMKFAETTVPRYDGVPPTPPPRRNRIDTQLFGSQKKSEEAMQMLVHFFENGDPQSLQVVGALLRSQWEDLHQQRRGLLAGRKAPILGPRSDDNRPRLLTREEEQKLRQANPPRPRQSRQEGFGSHQFRSKTPRKGKGKGKGKGGSQSSKPTPQA